MENISKENIASSLSFYVGMCGDVYRKDANDIYDASLRLLNNRGDQEAKKIKEKLDKIKDLPISFSKQQLYSSPENCVDSFVDALKIGELSDRVESSLNERNIKLTSPNISSKDLKYTITVEREGYKNKGFRPIKDIYNYDGEVGIEYLVNNKVFNQLEKGMISPETLTLAVLNKNPEMSVFDALAIGGVPAEIFGYDDRIVDNILFPDERNLCYKLEEDKLLSTEREEVVLYNGRTWRSHFFKLNKENILKNAREYYGRINGDLDKRMLSSSNSKKRESTEIDSISVNNIIEEEDKRVKHKEELERFYEGLDNSLWSNRSNKE